MLQLCYHIFMTWNKGNDKIWHDNEHYHTIDISTIFELILLKFFKTMNTTWWSTIYTYQFNRQFDLYGRTSRPT